MQIKKSQPVAISIHSLRVEGDWCLRMLSKMFTNFNPLPPCGGRRVTLRQQLPKQRFQSTPSVWRETAATMTRRTQTMISIHSLRVEGDAGGYKGC